MVGGGFRFGPGRVHAMRFRLVAKAVPPRQITVRLSSQGKTRTLADVRFHLIQNRSGMAVSASFSCQTAT